MQIRGKVTGGRRGGGEMDRFGDLVVGDGAVLAGEAVHRMDGKARAKLRTLLKHLVDAPISQESSHAAHLS